MTDTDRLPAIPSLPERIGVVGYDLRENPVLRILDYSLGEGPDVGVYHPGINLAMYGSNRNFILHAILHIGRWLQTEIDMLLKWDQLVITQKFGEELTSRISVSGRLTLDLGGSSAAVINSVVIA